MTQDDVAASPPPDPHDDGTSSRQSTLPICWVDALFDAPLGFLWPEIEPGSRMIGFNHVSLNCRDVAAQERFYVKHFGFQRSRTFRPGKPNEFVMLKLGSIRLELHPSDSANADQKGGEQAIGFKHLAFDAPKLEPTIESLRADGIEPDPITDISKHIPGCRVVFFRDPEGNLIEFMEGYYDEE